MSSLHVRVRYWCCFVCQRLCCNYQAQSGKFYDGVKTDEFFAGIQCCLDRAHHTHEPQDGEHGLAALPQKPNFVFKCK